jgi:hypothetical protein
MADIRQRSRVKFGGGSVLGLSETSIILGKGEKITDIDYNNITRNRLFFDNNYFIHKYEIIDPVNKLGSNIISIDPNIFITYNEVVDTYQKILIPKSGIIIDTDNNISVDSNLTGWNNSNNIITTYSNIGIGTTFPLANIHITNENSSIIIDNNHNKFKFNYNDLNYFVFGNYDTNNELFQHIEQFKIHKNAKSNSIIIDDNNLINLNSNIIISGSSFLTSNIFINNSNITHWLSNNGLASSNYVNQKIITTPNTILKGKGKEITELDYNNIIYNKLNFLPPFSIDDNNNISIDLNVTGGWTKDNITTNIYSIGSKIGIGNSSPMATLHLGTMNFSRDNINDNDGSLVISRSSLISSRNFKFGYDNNFNFILGDVNILNNWTSRISFNNNNTININNNLNINGSISLNSFNINYNNSTSNFTLGPNLLFINNSGSIGIGTLPNSFYKLIIDGNTKINSNLDINNINANNCSFTNLTVLNTIDSRIITTPNLTSTNIISSRNINNSLNIITNSLNSTSIVNRNLLTTADIICNNNITGSSINLNDAFISNILNTRTINATTLNLNNITSTNINNTNNITTLNIISTNINSRNNINCDNTITANTIRTSILNSSENITTNLFNATTANLNNLTALNTVSSFNIICTNNFTGNIINGTSLTVNSINSPTITTTTLTTNSIVATTLSASGNIITNSTLNANTIITTNFICLNNIGIGTTLARSTLHLNESANANSSILFTNLNDISIKIGYNANDFTLGTYNINTNIWTNQFSINSSAPANTFNINSSGNIGIGAINTNDNNYKLLINGTVNATNFFKNGEELSTISALNTNITSRLASYLSIENANNTFYKNTQVDSLINTTNANIFNNIANSFQYDNNIYSSENRLPTANTLKNIITNSSSSNYYNNTIIGFRETFLETKKLDNNDEININYELYSSGGDKVKFRLFTYDSEDAIININWNPNTYDQRGIFMSDNDSNFVPNSNLFYDLPSFLDNDPFNSYITLFGNGKYNYRGEFLIFKVSETFTLKRFRFYIRKISFDNNLIANAPGTWLCYGSVNGSNWIYISEASNPTSRLNQASYIYNINDAYYEHSVYNNILECNFIGFIFHSLINLPGQTQLRTLRLSRIEIFGKFKITPIYISSNVFNSTLVNYAFTSEVNSKLSKDITFSYPLEFNNNSISLNSNYLLLLTNNNDSPDFRSNLQNTILNYISSNTNVWKSDNNNPQNYYYNNTGCVGIGTTIVNVSRIQNLKLDINGSLKTSRIIANTISGNGEEITNINFNNITNLPDLRNIYNWNTSTENNITNCYSTFNGNLGINFIYSSPLQHKFNVNGSIFSSNNIICSGDFIENGTNLINKYLTLSAAQLNYFSNIGGIISGSVGIGTSISPSYRLNINGNFNSTNIFENGINIIDKYLTINNATNTYISRFTSGIIFNDLFVTGNVGIGTTIAHSNNRLSINGSLFTSSNIISSNFIENGSNLIDKYLTISNAISNYYNNTGGIISGSVAIGTSISSSHRLNVNGSIFSSNNIICSGDFIENGSNLINKYLTISSATTNYLSNVNPSVIGNITCSGSISENGILLSNKYLSQNEGLINGNLGFGTTPSLSHRLNINGSIFSSNNIICSGEFIENGSELINKYLTIASATNNYLSNVNPSVIGNISCSGSISENGILLSNKYLSQDGGVINGNIGFGTTPSLTHKLNINGSIFSSNNIICSGDFIENGSNLINKYLTISSATNNYLSNVNPSVIGNISCSGSISENGILLSNKYLSQDGGVINGNIGFGTTPSPLYRLNINGSIFLSRNIISRNINCSNIISRNINCSNINCSNINSSNIISSNIISSNINCINIKENGSNLSDIYIKIADFPNYSNINNNIDNPNLQKKIGIKFVCSEEIILNNITYYKYNINITKYVNNKYDYIDNNPYRIFNIKCFSTDAVFRSSQINKPPNILQYDIYMSHLLNLDPISLNICAIGFPSNYYLNKITAGDIFILKTNNYNYISILSKFPNTNISCIITDFLF